MYRFGLVSLLLGMLFWGACTKESNTPASIQLVAANMNGSSLQNNATNIPVESVLEFVFSSSVDRNAFESAFSISGNPSISFAYGSQSSRVTIDLTLQAETTYQVSVAAEAIGMSGGMLESAFQRSFTTADDGLITTLPPCTTGSASCLQTIALEADGTANVQFYSSFPIYEEEARWDSLRAAVIVIHGANRNADDYFSWMMSSLQAQELAENTVLISPQFKVASEAAADEFFWGTNTWREGRDASSSAKISSFEVIDRIIAQLANKELFPVMEKVIVTGHSSGGLFTHVYAASNLAEAAHNELDMTYVVANSQYFYYPNGQRVDEATNELYTPSSCNGYNFWPLGFNIQPNYLSNTSESVLNDQFKNRKITYLLGNGTGADGALNESDCAAVLLGSSRYQRGENMYRFMELEFGESHQHERVIVEGIGHDGQAMYQSATFRMLLQNLLD